MIEYSPTKFILLKVANRCNLNCTYCYWFKDKSVYEKSKIINADVLQAFYLKLRRHIIKYKLSEFTVSLHGGEPLLAGKNVILGILNELTCIGKETSCLVKFHIQSNILLCDEEWIEMFKTFNVRLGVSIDGPKSTHDLYRVDLAGKPTFDRTMVVIDKLKEKKIHFGLLAVCDPLSDPEEICDFFINKLGITSFDILIPDANHDNIIIPKIKDYYIKLIKIWYERYYYEGVDIRIVKNILRGIIGKKSRMQAIGFVPIDTCMIKPDGELEALDSLHSIGYNSTKGALNILNNEIDDISKDTFWKEVFEKSIQLNSKCLICKYQLACGGGHIASRWSKERRFDNPSVYCDQLYDIFEFSNQFVLDKLKSYKVENRVV